MNTTCTFDVDVAEKDVQLFSQLSGDTNPLHMDAAYAGTTEFGRPIAHGALLVGLVSRVLGMHIPGRESLILSMKIEFPKPSFYPTRVRVEGRLKSYDEKRNVGLVDVKIEDLNKGWPVLTAEVTFSKHAVTGNGKPRPVVTPSITSSSLSNGKTGTRRLLITGGTGGIGKIVMDSLKSHFELVCLTRHPDGKPSVSGMQYLGVDIDDVQAFAQFLQTQNPADFYGVIHLSVPPVSVSFLSDDLPALRRHLRHAVEVPVELAHWARQSGSELKRFILMGSTFGVLQPKPHIGAYSLAKAAMEQMSRLLTADFAAQKATVNTVIASVIPAGLNEGMPERSRKSLTGKVPTGRLVEPQDIANVLAFLLSDAAAQINGTAIRVDGGTLE